MSTEAIALLDPDDTSQFRPELEDPADDDVTHPGTPKSEHAASAPHGRRSQALADLDDPRLVLSDGYVGLDRRRAGGRWSLLRITYLPRRALFRLDALIVLAVIVVIAGAVLVVTARPRPPGSLEVTVAAQPTRVLGAVPRNPTVATTAVATPCRRQPCRRPPCRPSASAVPAAPVVDPSSPRPWEPPPCTRRYPWQQLPGYSIQFLPISDAPSPGILRQHQLHLGPAGRDVHDLRLPRRDRRQAGRHHHFEIGHEVDAAYVEPEGGHDQIGASWNPPGELGPRMRLRRARLPVGLVCCELLGLLVTGRPGLEHARPAAHRCDPGCGLHWLDPEFRRIGALSIVLPPRSHPHETPPPLHVPFAGGGPGTGRDPGRPGAERLPPVVGGWRS